MTVDTVVRGGTVVLPEHGAVAADVAIDGEHVAGLFRHGTDVPARRTIDAEARLVLPGLIDPHVHIGYEGYAGMPLEALPDHFATESASALVGGVTTVLVTYRNAADFLDIFDDMRAAGVAHSRVDFGYSLGITNDAHAAAIPEYFHRFGVSSFKFYMAYRGEDAKASGNVYNRYDDGLLFAAAERIAALPGAMAMVHPENAEIIALLRGRLEGRRDDLAAWTESRPDFVEAESIARALFVCGQAGCPVYIPHLSCARSLDVVAAHRARTGATPVFVETCPHYLTHTTDAACGVLAKVNPPVRSDADVDALWTALGDGVVDTVGTDHCGVARADKGPDVWGAVPGFAGMATMLAALLTGVGAGRLALDRVPSLTSTNTARIFNLYPRKGTLLPGSDADLVVVDPGLRRRVTADALGSRSDFSIYEGRELAGWPVLTMTRGEVAMADGEVLRQTGTGRYLERRPQDDETAGRRS